MMNFSKRSLRTILATLLALLCLTAVLFLPGARFSTVALAQKRTRRTPAKPRATKITSPGPTTTPTPSILDELGEPPPPPTPPARQQQDVNPGDVISISTTEVMLPVTVRDQGGRLITELTRNDFRVFEDGREQPLSDLALRQVPVDVVLMVDASSSVATNLDDFRRAAEGFAARLAPEDRISLIKFDDRVELLQDWTQSRFQLHRALNRIEPGMFTRFNDALMLCAKDQFGRSKSRHAAIVLSDGIDSGRGATTLEGAVIALLKAQVSVYIVSNIELSRATTKAQLDELVGGTNIRVDQLQIDDLREGL